jgi:uridylate kinase
MDHNKHIVISLGGSLIVPHDIDVNFVSNFVNLIKEYAGKGYKFVIITGGGATARTYINASKSIGDSSNTDLDWIGIACTRLNSELLRTAFGELAHEHVVLDPDNVPSTDKSIIMSAGWKPGNSSDLAAIHCARSVGAHTLINLSNIDYAYDKDPKKYPDAVKIEESNWADFRKILPEEWDPGLNAPFDPVAAREAEALGLEVVIMNGKNIDNLKAYLDGDKFLGTVIH